MPFSFSVALILYNLQDKRWMQLLSAPTVAVRVHQKTSSYSVTSGSSAPIQTSAAAVSWLLSVIDENRMQFALSWLSQCCPALLTGKAKLLLSVSHAGMTPETQRKQVLEWLKHILKIISFQPHCNGIAQSPI